jgi:Collagen triple helix repeat (20 copies)
VGVTVALVLATTGLAVASIPAGSGVIFGCYSKNDGALRVINKGKAGSTGKCRKSEAALSWSQQGRQGISGSAGAPGIQGITGLKGDSGIQGPKGETGVPGPTIRWALFNANGTIVEQSGGISLTAMGTSDYYINMGAQVTGHALLATISQKAGGFGAKILAGLCGPFTDGLDCSGTIGSTANADGQHVHVFIADGTTATPEPFYLVMFP